jgi:hypothetical protein
MANRGTLGDLTCLSVRTPKDKPEKTTTPNNRVIGAELVQILCHPGE